MQADAKAFDFLRQILWGRGIPIHMHNEERAAAVMLDAHATNAGPGEKIIPVAALDLDGLLLRKPDVHNKVTWRERSTSSRWFAMVWVVEPAMSKPTARLLWRSTISDPESPGWLKVVPFNPVMTIWSSNSRAPEA